MEKKRKILLIVLAIVAAIAIIAILLSIENGEHGNKLEMTCLTEDVAASHKTPQVYITLENSKSMKGYVAKEPKIEYQRMTFEGVIGDIVSKLNNADFPTYWQCGNKKGQTTIDLYSKGIKDGSIFAEGDTPLEEYIRKLGEQANDSTVSVFVSDMVFSMSTSNMRNNPEAIKSALPKLQTLLSDALRLTAKKNIHIMLIQYTSDFNGKYYYNCTNNITKCEFKNEVLHHRPFYVLALGTRENLNSLIKAKVLPAYEKLWASFSLNDADVAMKQEVKTETDSHWRNYDPKAQEGSPFTFWTETDWEDQESMVKLSFAQLASRAFLNPEWNPHCTSPAVNVFKNSNTEIVVHIKPYNQLQTIEEIKISLISDRFDWKACSIENDILSKDEISQLEGKTWAFDKFMDALAEVYPTIIQPEIVGTIEFKLMKN